MAPPRIATRLYVEESLDGPGRVIGLDHQRAHYLRAVLRLARGAHLALFNGRDGEWLARIEGLGKGWASLELVNQRRPQAREPDVEVVFAPIKRARIDFLVEKATELGAAAFRPMFTRHTDVARVNTERLAANAREAAEQCERLTIPTVHAPLGFGELCAGLEPRRRVLLCAAVDGAPPVADVLAQAGEDAPWAVMAGPEGGFHADELDALRRLPFVSPVALGPRVLRSDTAVLAALACWQAWLGDGRDSPPDRPG